MTDLPTPNGCDDWRSTRRRALAQAPRMVPLPDQALDGLENFAKGGGITRRDALERGAGLFVACTAASGMSLHSLLDAAAAEAADNPNGTILVSLCLDGGNDGLNTLIPLADPRYHQLRSRVGIASEKTLPLKGVSEFGWHPALGGLQKLFDAGKVAVLPSVDYAKPDLSHFRSAGFWRTGIAVPSRVTTGWLGRTLDAMGGYSNPLKAVSLNGNFDSVLSSKRAPSATVYDPGDFSMWVRGVWEEDTLLSAYRQSAAGSTRSTALKAAKLGYRQTITIKNKLKPLAGDAKDLPPTPVPYPDTETGRGLKNLARMLDAGLGTRIAALTAEGGFDTHDNQPEEHERLLKDLGDSLWAWQADLQARGLSRRVITLVWSEFGRRPEDNESNGTDHGAGGLALVVGDRANGGIRSEFPGLAKLDPDDNLRVTTEFRTVYASLLEGWLGVEAGKVLPGIGRARLPLVGA